MTDILIDGDLSDWTASEQIDGGAVAGYQIYAKADANDYIFALSAPMAIGLNTTVWLNTDHNVATGYQIFGFAGGAEFNVNFDINGTPMLYTGAAGGTPVLDSFGQPVALSFAYNADHTAIEFRIAKSDIGSPDRVGTLYDFNDTQVLPTSYSGNEIVVWDDSAYAGLTAATDTKIAIVYSETTANNYFSKTAYSQLFMASQSQAMQAGISFDILTEADLTNLATLAQYKAIVFPSFRNVQADQVDLIAHTLELASEQYHVGLIVSGEFMTDDQNNAPLPGNSYAYMAKLLDATRVTGGFPADVTITATDPTGLVFDGYADGELINQYSGVGWNAFTSVSGTGTTVATETVGGTTYTAVLATQTGGRNVLFSGDGVMADTNLLQKAIDYVVNGDSVSVALHITRDEGIVSARVDMDQSLDIETVDPTDGSPGIYDVMNPILQTWKDQYNFVGSFYVNIAMNTSQATADAYLAITVPYYTALVQLGNEIGTHSYTHPEDTNLLSASQIEFEFATSTTLLQNALSAALGYNYVITGAAVPGAPETLATSLLIEQYVSTYMSGGYTGEGAGYPNAFGYLTPDSTDKVYLAPNTFFDFTLIQWLGLSPEAASALWAAQYSEIRNHGDTPIIVWPWHDYGLTGYDAPGYVTQMFTDYVARAANDDMEFVTMGDLASRINAFEQAQVTTSIVGNVITATVTASNVGQFALDLNNQGNQVITSVNGWYAYDSDSVFMPATGGTFTITLGAAPVDVTHIIDLPMRASLVSVSGDGNNISFTVEGEGKIVIDLADPAGRAVTVTGATVVSQVGDILTIDVGSLGTHNVTVTMPSPPVITSDGGGATAAISVAENGSAVTTVTSTDVDGPAATYSISGGADAALFAIDAVTGVLSFIAAPDFEVPTDTAADNVYDVIVTASDGTLTDTQAIAVTVTNVNEAPVITSNDGGDSAAISIAENIAAVTTVTSTDVDGPSATYSISGGTDAALFAIDAVTGALTFIAAPNFEAPADDGANNVYDVNVTVSDGTLTDTQALAVTVTDVNEAPPVITSNGGGDNAAVSIAENTSAVTTVTSTDLDGPAATYSISGGADAALFAIDATTGALSFIAAPNFDAPADAGVDNVYDVIVTASDGSLTDTQALAVTVTNVNEAPVITSNGGGTTATMQVVENTTAVTTVVATEPDGTPVTYSIGGTDSAFFTIDPVTGALRFKSAPDFETRADNGGNNTYNFVVFASDGVLKDSQALAVTVTNVNEAPVITSNGGGDSAAISISENATAITTVTSTDPEGKARTYSISGGADAALFAINDTTGALTLKSAPNFEAPADTGADNVYDVIVAASDGVVTDTQALAVSVTNVDETAAIISNGGGDSAAISVAENSVAVTTVISTDANGIAATYSISGGADAALFAIDATTGALNFIAAPNFETPTDSGADNVYDVIVAASDGTVTDTQALAVTVTNINEAAPVITSNGGGTTAAISMPENTTVVTTVAATDPDGTPVTYSIWGTDYAFFTIDPLTGVLQFKAAPDFETRADNGGNNTYNFYVIASDGTFRDIQALAVTVTNVNEAPVITSNGGGTTGAISISENSTTVTTVTSTDPDGTARTYSISGGADAALFAINAATGALTFRSNPNFEAPADAGTDNVYDVVVAASDGVLTDTQALAVTVTNVDEGIAITSNGGGDSAAISLAENSTAVTTVISTDANGAAITYSISGGADAALFAIDATTGALSFVSAPNFEAAADAGANNVYDVTVAATDGTLTDTQALAVTVTNVNEAAPVITSNGGGTTAAISMPENTTAVTTVAATDPDGTPVTYSIWGTDYAFFTIDPLTGVLQFKAAPDFETRADNGGNNTYNFYVIASDGTFRDIQALAVTVTNQTGITLSGGGTLNGTGEEDTLTGGNGANILNGLGANDRLDGAGGADVLNGGDGNDVLIGGDGQDTLTGGAGADTFTFTTIAQSVVGTNHDIIDDFLPGTDRFDFSGIDANTGIAGDQAFTFLATEGAAFTGAAQIGFHYEVIGGTEYTIVQGNVNATLTPDFEIALLGHQDLSAASFVL